MARNSWTALEIVLAVVVLCIAPVETRAPQKARTDPAGGAAAYKPVLQQYCYGCHNARTKSGNLTLDNLDLSHIADDAAVWEKVIRKLRGGVMPPRNLPRPDANTHEQLTSWLENEIDRVAVT